MWPRLALIVGFVAGVAAAALILGGILVLAPEPVPSATPVPTLVPTASPEPSPTPTPVPSPSVAPSTAPSGPAALPSGSPPVGGDGGAELVRPVPRSG
jgi:hypothetical protein